MNWDELENVMYRYWVSLPEPKIDYTQWWYRDGGIRDMLQTYHIPEPVYEDRFLLKPKLRMKSTCPKCGSDLGHYPNCPDGICFIKEAK